MPKSACKDFESQAINHRYLFVQKENHKGLPWNVLRDFIKGHLHDEDGIIAFALFVYGLVIFPGMLGYIKMAMVDTFEQIQHGNNPSLVILVETF